jgi:hypothetical protein
MGLRDQPTAQQMDRVHARLVAALTAPLRMAEHGGPDFAGARSAALQDVARTRGGAGALVESRPGSWEADHVRQLGGIESDWGY